MKPARDTLRITLPLADEAATDALGARLAALLQPGDIVALQGDLGAGKTHLCRALIQARLRLGGDPPEEVPSPSYTLVQTYAAAGGEIWHADLYRLGGPDEVLELGLQAAFDSAAICLIEWADRLGPALPRRAMTITLAMATAERQGDGGQGDGGQGNGGQGDGGRTAFIEIPADRVALADALRTMPAGADAPAACQAGAPPRPAAMSAFVEASGWGEATRGFLAGDASNRRYDRLRRTSHTGDQTAVLMDAPPEKGEDVVPFIAIGAHLRALGLSAPAVLAEDRARGFLLLEDLGDDLFARVLSRAQHGAQSGAQSGTQSGTLGSDKPPASEARLYAAATDVLVQLAATPPPGGLDVWGAPQMAKAATLAVTWYGGAISGRDADPAPLAAAIEAAVLRHAPPPSVLVLRDYHAENLIWLPRRTGLARVGLLDFQSAELGPPGYDLISLLQDARRDVGPRTDRAMRARFAQATGQTAATLEAALAVLGAQRALRILGVFARLCLRDGKPGYLRLIPRVWGHLRTNLRHPGLADVAPLVHALLPAPDTDALHRIEARCARAPTA
jgi:tRNA threonylcarbamoyl adenosine modification protein YjeE